MSNINLNIEALTIDGFSREDSYAIRDAFESELKCLFKNSDPSKLSHLKPKPSELSTTVNRSSSTSAQSIGRQAARSLVRELWPSN